MFYFLITYNYGIDINHKIASTCLACLELLNLNVQGTNSIKSIYLVS